MGAYELEGRRIINDVESPSAETTWQVSGATSYTNARATLDSALPTSFTFPSSRVAYLDGVKATELLADEFFEFTVSYNSQTKPSANDTEFEFEVSAQTERIFQSIATTSYAPAGKTAPNFGGAIGVQQGRPEGVQPLTPFSTFSYTKHWPVASVTQAYQIAVEALVGAVCNTTWLGRDAGTIRFLGARGRTSGDKFPISYQFGFRPNISSLTVDGITVTSANGWDIIDPYYEFQVDTTAKKRTMRPRAVYVHQVHELDSLAGLNL